jgi:protein gp37
MAEYSAIEWTDSTWNPVTGCTKISPGCAHCYAEAFAERWRGVKGHPYEQGFDLKLWPQRLNLPFTWKEPRIIFVNSMSDLFHKDVPDNFIAQVFDVMSRADHHIFQVLTKRSERMMQWCQANYKDKLIPKNIWLGVSVENQKFTWRIEQLQKTPAQTRFLSLEPLLGPIDLTESLLKGIHWAIVGGESGPMARPMDPGWARSIRGACKKFDVPFFFKQWGAFSPSGERVGKKAAGRILDGKVWNQMPKEFEERAPMLISV